MHLKQAAGMTPQIVADLLDIPQQDVAVRLWNENGDDELPAPRREAEGGLPAAGRIFKPDLVADTGWLKLVIVWRTTSAASNILLAVRHLMRHWPTGMVPVLLVPYMGKVGADLCRREGISWFDLSGNAYLRGPGLTVRLEGRPNRFLRRGRPASVFAPRSVRVARFLLMNVGVEFSQKDIALGTGLDAGFVSRIVRQLEADGLVERHGSKVICENGRYLLTAWTDAADFGANRIVKGRIGTITSEKLFLKTFLKAGEALRDYEADYLTTGLGAAHLLSGFAGFSQGVFYLREEPSAALLDWLSFIETSDDGNIWLVVPRDDGVFEGMTEIQGLRCAHPAQVYADLKDMPGRVEKAGHMIWERVLGY